MKPEQLRANMAGYLDGASTLIQSVHHVCMVGRNTPQENGNPKINAPDALFEQLTEARRILAQCSDWLLDPNNTKLEKCGG